MGLFDDNDDRGAPPIAKKPAIARVRYTHDAVIDQILAQPEISQNELAKMFGFSVTWMSIIINSDAFQARLAERKGELVDPKIQASIEARLEAVAKVSLDRLIDRLEQSNGQAIKTSDLVAIAKLGVGDRNTRPAGPQQQNNLYVVALPPPAANSAEWLQSRSFYPAPQTVIQAVEE